ncbi:MAG: hypothetical protein A2Y12_04930 [Planctomycetes bacterium GWF2_42_9]|nr:MAG: hypothetical protein A2Y12_04930 [Planctomycetes bacterium GWF2_42_9]
MEFHQFQKKISTAFILFWLLMFFFQPDWLLADLSIDNLPVAEREIKNNVDHWGLAFSDQLNDFRKNFNKFSQITGIESPTYILGVETSLRKTFKNKYWFKGQITNTVQLYAARNESEAFQLAIIPNTGIDINDVEVKALDLKSKNGKYTISSNDVSLWQVGFAKTAVPQYPTHHIGYWPDPLFELKPFSLSKVDLGLIWCEIKVTNRRENMKVQ